MLYLFFPLFLVQIFVVLFLFFSGFPHFFFNLTLARLFLVVVVFYVFFILQISLHIGEKVYLRYSIILQIDKGHKI